MKTSLKLALLLFFITINLFAQIDIITKYPIAYTAKSKTSSQIIGTSTNDLIMFWVEENKLHMSISYDFGKSWNNKQLLANDVLTYSDRNNIGGIKTNNDNIIIAYNSSKTGNDGYFIKYLISNDNGITWTNEKILNDYESYNPHFNLSRTLDGTIWFVLEGVYKLYCIKSRDNGLTWSNKELLIDGNFNYSKQFGSIQSLNENALILFYKQNMEDKIFYRLSFNKGITWGTGKVLIGTGDMTTSPKSIRLKDGSIYIFYRKLKDNFDKSGEIFYIKNTNKTTDWLEEEKLTNYVGDDNFINIAEINNKAWISFASNRWQRALSHVNAFIDYNIWYGIAEESLDTLTPPLITQYMHTPQNPGTGDSITFYANVYDEDSIRSVELNIYYDRRKVHSVNMMKTSHYYNYSITMNNLEYHNLITYSITVIDIQNLKVVEPDGAISFINPYGSDNYTVNINNLILPLNDNGVLAGYHSATYENQSIFYSSGFFISGVENGNIFSNGIFTSSRIEGIYKPGKIGSNPYDGRNTIYTIRSTDPEFGESWQNWKNAVSLGANYYDGDNNDVYNPVDKNNNNRWDLNEDRPDLIGDFTAWCIYNDMDNGLTESVFSTNAVIEVKQTVFASKALETEPLRNTIFIRYELENKNKYIDQYDSVYFGIVTDPDIGREYYKDLVGCDTVLNAGFAYKAGPDPIEYGSGYGDNPPALLIKILEGPPTFIPGETFIDNNYNEVFDDGDIPLDSAINKLGPYLGEISIQGAKNLLMTNFYHFFRYGYGYEHPDNIFEMRNQLLPGLNQYGERINVCELQYGNGSTLSDCDLINPNFMFSGDPVDSSGWLCTQPADTRMLLSTGPFELKQNEPITIIVAYIVGRGNNPRHSVIIAKEFSNKVAEVYDNNFVDLPVGVVEETNNISPLQFSLSQNYPNPFNPTTTIKYTIPDVETTRRVVFTKLTVFNILGQEVATLVNKEQKPGSYEVEFNANHLSSGVYFYTLRAGLSTGSGQGFLQTMKMVLLR